MDMIKALVASHGMGDVTIVVGLGTPDAGIAGCSAGGGTMKLQRYDVKDGGYEKAAEFGTYCLSDDVESLEAENAALHAECDRLTAMLCKVPTKEAEAAYDQIDRYLRNNLDDSEYADMSAALEHCYRTLLYPQKPMSAEEVTEPGFYWQRDDDNCEWGVNYVSSVGWMTQGGVSERLEIYGQFIGPIPYPDADHADG